MKPNAKTLGGFIVLPYPDTEITWDEYKALYGVDLDKIVRIADTSGQSGKRLFIERKPIFLSDAYPNSSAVAVLPVVGHDSGDTQVGDEYIAFVDLFTNIVLDINDMSISTFKGIRITSDKKIKYLEA